LRTDCCFPLKLKPRSSLELSTFVLSPLKTPTRRGCVANEIHVNAFPSVSAIASLHVRLLFLPPLGIGRKPWHKDVFCNRQAAHVCLAPSRWLFCETCAMVCWQREPLFVDCSRIVCLADVVSQRLRPRLGKTRRVTPTDGPRSGAPFSESATGKEVGRDWTPMWENMLCFDGVSCLPLPSSSAPLLSTQKSVFSGIVYK